MSGRRASQIVLLAIVNLLGAAAVLFVWSGGMEFLR
jgi:hypothetical protein